MEGPILCVDDDENILEVLSEMLEAAGMPVLVARTGYDALALAICHSRAATSLLNTERVFDPNKYDTR